MTPPATATATAAPARAALQSSVPFKITDRPDGLLPDMEGFSLQRLGTLEKGWHSVCPIRADRDLAKGEVLSAFLIRERDGEMVRLDYTAVDTALKADQWPPHFAQHIADNGAGLSAGGWTSDGKLTCGSADGLSLWCRNPYRAFSTAPFRGNLAQALACDERYKVGEGKSLCLQVRDLATQHLYEHHVFTPGKEHAGAAWAQALCQQVNSQSRLLRAGVLGADGCSVVPAAAGNAFWVAQCAGLSVTLAEVSWWASQEVDGNQPLPAEGAVQAWAYDAYSHRLLGQFSWSPAKEARGAGKWLSAWATALNASELAPWLCASDKTPSPQAAAVGDAKRLTLWQRGEGVRVFTSLPAADNWVAGPALSSAWNSVNSAVLVTVRHPYSRQLLGHEVFVPQAPADQNAWEQALGEAIALKGWPEVVVGREASDATLDRAGKGKGGWRLWQPRFAGLLVELEALGEGGEWNPERLGEYLGNTDEMPVRASHDSFQAEVSDKAYHEGSALIYINYNPGELVFRLDPEAKNKGYRVADCFRETSHTYISAYAKSDVEVTSVSADAVAWAKGRKKTAFRLLMDVPDTHRGSAALTIGHIGYLDDSALWQGVVEVKFTPPKALPAYKPSSALCEDYGNTMASEVFDASGQSETGVDPRTGLFHAHYPIATLQGLAGRGPVCELTLHYSALRGNEAGLGDGWAWRFASLDTRDRRLVMENGATVVFTDDEWEELGKGTRLSKHGCFIRSDKDWSQFTLDLPSGRQEILGKPSAAGSDEQEHNDAFRLEIIRLLEAIKKNSTPQFPTKPEGVTQWALAIICPSGYSGAAALDYAAALKAWGEKTKELDDRIAYYKRPFAQLLPHTITSPYGETLTLSWQRLKGQFLLKQVCSGDTPLLKGEYSAAKVGLEIWPTSAEESFTLSLGLEQHLLRTMKRSQGAGTGSRLLHEVRCDYCVDPTLDRVLYRLQESDGSVELVEYQANAVTFPDGRPSLPRVSRHVLIPGSGAENVASAFSYRGKFFEDNSSYGSIKHSQEAKEFKEFKAGGVMGVAVRATSDVLKLEMQNEAGSHNGTICDLTASTEALCRTIDGLVKAPWMPSSGAAEFWSRSFATAELYGKELLAAVEKLWSCNIESTRLQLKDVKNHEISEAGDDPILFFYVIKKTEKDTRNNFPEVEHAEDSLTLSGFKHPELVLNASTSLVVMEKLMTADGGPAISELDTLRALIGTAVPIEYRDAFLQGGLFDLLAKAGAYAVTALASPIADTPFGFFLKMVMGVRYLHSLLQDIGCSPFDEKAINNLNPKQKPNLTKVSAFSMRTQTVDYTPNHEIKKITSSENKISYRCYYSAKGANTLTPDLAKKLDEFPALSCPDIPAEAPPPLMAEYQCDAHGNPLGLILYGYRTVKRNERQVLETACIVTLEGIKATLANDELDASATWALADPSQEILWRMRSTTASEPAPKTANKDCKVKVWSITDEQTTVLGDEVLGMTLVQQFEDNPTCEGLQISTHATTKAGTELISREVRSRFSRRCLSKTADGAQTDFRHDGLGRVVEQVRYRLKPDGKRDEPSKAVTTTRYNFEHGSLVTQTSQPEGGERWDEFDGLQRLVRSAWRPSAKGALVPLQVKFMRGTGDEAVASQAWDYLPGGQAIYEPVQVVALPGRQAWSRDLLDSAYTVEEGLGPHTLRYTSSDLQNRVDGTLTCRETQRSAEGEELAGTFTTMDANGRVIAVEQTIDGILRKQCFTRDPLGRVTRHERPDGSAVQRSYHGLSEQVTELRVFEKGQAAASGRLMASQEVSNASSLSKRTVGNRQYRFEGDNVTLPDKTRLTLSKAYDTGEYKAGEALISGVTRSGNITTLASDSGQAGEGGLWKESLTATSLPGQQCSEHTSPYSARQGAAWQTLRGRTVASLRADGHWQRNFHDHYGRLLRSWHDHQDILYRYDDFDRLVERRVQATQAGSQWQVSSAHDVFGRETQRTFSHNGQPVFAQAMEWRSDGKLVDKRSRTHGKEVRHERFTYDALDRLATYACTAAQAEHCPSADGKPVMAQSFTWDALSNMTACTTTYQDGTARKQTFSYDKANPTQLTGITTDDDIKALTYNNNGYLTQDGQQRKLKYNPGGQLTEACDETGALLTRYAYDGYQRLANQYVAADKCNRELRYAGDALIGEDWLDASGQLVRQRCITPGLAEYEGATVNWLVDDPHSGISGHYGSQGLALTPLLPFGDGAQGDALSSGYNGMRRDPVTGNYHAGNGYRCYDPTMYRHAQPDWLSPFDEGGINDYVYCPDPINQHDPSGAIMLSRWGQSTLLAQLQQSLRDTQPFPVGSRWRGIAFSALLFVVGVGASILTGGTASMLVFAALTALSAASLALEVASVFIEDSNPELARKLAIASMVTGVLSIGNFVGAFKQAANLVRSAVSLAARLARSAAKASWRVLNAWGSRGFVGAYRYLKASSQAAKVSKASAQASAAVARGKVTSVLGELATPKFAVVESDAVQKLLTGKSHTLLTGWQARINAQVGRLSGATVTSAQAGDSAIVGWVLKGGVEMAIG